MIAISELKSGLTGWSVRAVVQKKSKITEYTNGKYFSCFFHDGESEIKAMAFHEHCDTFFSKIENDKCYILSGALIKNNTYKNVTTTELRLIKQTEVEPCEDEDDFIVIPKKENYIKLEECLNKSGQISIIGVLSNIVQKSVMVNKVEKKIIEATVVDETGEIVVTFWDPTEEISTQMTLDTVIAIEDAFLKELKTGGKGVNVSSTSKIQINPPWERTNVLNAWRKNKSDVSSVRFNFSQIMVDSSQHTSPKKSKRELEELLGDAEEELKKVEEKELQLSKKKRRLLMEIETLKSNI